MRIECPVRFRFINLAHLKSPCRDGVKSVWLVECGAGVRTSRLSDFLFSNHTTPDAAPIENSYIGIVFTKIATRDPDAHLTDVFDWDAWANSVIEQPIIMGIDATHMMNNIPAKSPICSNNGAKIQNIPATTALTPHQKHAKFVRSFEQRRAIPTAVEIIKQTMETGDMSCFFG